MNKALIAFAIISSLLLLAVGCRTNPTTPAPGAEATGQQTQSETSGTSDSGITGSINEIDKLDSELNDPEIEKTGEYLEEIEW